MPEPRRGCACWSIGPRNGRSLAAIPGSVNSGRKIERSCDEPRARLLPDPGRGQKTVKPFYFRSLLLVSVIARRRMLS
jgi:hypothetical protein